MTVRRVTLVEKFTGPKEQVTRYYPVLGGVRFGIVCGFATSVDGISANFAVARYTRGRGAHSGKLRDLESGEGGRSRNESHGGGNWIVTILWWEPTSSRATPQPKGEARACFCATFAWIGACLLMRM